MTGPDLMGTLLEFILTRTGVDVGEERSGQGGDPPSMDRTIAGT